MNLFSIRKALTIAVLFRLTIQDCTQCSTDQPTIDAPRKNVWRPLSEKEVLDATSVVTQKLHLNTDPAQKYVDHTS